MSYKITCNGIDVNDIDWEIEFKLNKVNPVNRITLPKSQTEIIKKALLFYIETSRRLNSVPTDTEAYELYDARQLMGMMDYIISIEITESEKENFTGKYGIDFPTYI
jgi:hypothetical protein